MQTASVIGDANSEESERVTVRATEGLSDLFRPIIFRAVDVETLVMMRLVVVPSVSYYCTNKTVYTREGHKLHLKKECGESYAHHRCLCLYLPYSRDRSSSTGAMSPSSRSGSGSGPTAMAESSTGWYRAKRARVSIPALVTAMLVLKQGATQVKGAEKASPEAPRVCDERSYHWRMTNGLK